MHYRILGAPLSPFVRKVRVFCFEKDIGYDLEPVNPFAPPEGFADISPLRRIPVLVIEHDDGSREYLPDSSVICAFLDQMHPEHRLIPEAPLARGQALWFEEYGDTELTGAIGQGIFRPVVLRQLGGQTPDRPKAEDTVANRLPPLFDYLEGQIGEREFLVEDRFTIADLGIVSPLVNMQHAGYEVDEARWPRLARYAARVIGRESFQHALKAERAMLTG